MNVQILQDGILALSGAGVAIGYFSILLLLVIILPSFRVIGPTQVGLVTKRFSFKKLKEDNPIAFNGEAAYIEQTGKAAGAQVEAIGMARAKAYEAQVRALGQSQTAIVNVATVLSEGKAKFMPDVLVAGGGGSVEGLAATLIKHFQKSDAPQTVVPVVPVKTDVKRV